MLEMIMQNVLTKKKKAFIQGTSNQIYFIHSPDETYNEELKIQTFL